jgi:hypothetical protein
VDYLRVATTFFAILLVASRRVEQLDCAVIYLGDRELRASDPNLVIVCESHVASAAWRRVWSQHRSAWAAALHSELDSALVAAVGSAERVRRPAAVFSPNPLSVRCHTSRGGFQNVAADQPTVVVGLLVDAVCSACTYLFE